VSIMDQQNIGERILRIENDLSKITERNRNVELDKAWETSRTRVFAVVCLTYALMCLIFWVIGVQNFSVNAIVPTVGYFLSTQSLPVVKRLWLRNR